MRQFDGLRIACVLKVAFTRFEKLCNVRNVLGLQMTVQFIRMPGAICISKHKVCSFHCFEVYLASACLDSNAAA